MNFADATHLRDRIRAAIEADPDRQRVLAGLRQTHTLGHISEREYDRRLDELLRAWELEDGR